MNIVNWFEIPTTDIDRAARFWETVLSLKLKRADDPSGAQAIFPYEAPGVGGALVRRESSKPAAGGVVVYLDTRGDLDGAIARAQKAGGKVIVPKTDISPNGAFAIVLDTEGNAVGIHAA